MTFHYEHSKVGPMTNSDVILLIDALWSAIEQNDSRFSIIFISYFYKKDGGRWETYCLYGVEGDGILSIL